MKLFTFLLLLFSIAAFSSCGNYRKSHDVIKGTPTRADTVLPHKYPPMQETKTASNEEPADVYRR